MAAAARMASVQTTARGSRETKTMDRQRTSGDANVVGHARATGRETWRTVMVGKTASGATLVIAGGCVVGRGVRTPAGIERVWELDGGGLGLGCEVAAATREDFGYPALTSW